MEIYKRKRSMEIRKLLGIVIILSAFACSEQVEPNETRIQVTGIEETTDGCIYSVEAVIPYQPYIKDKITDVCGKYSVGDQFFVRW